MSFEIVRFQNIDFLNQFNFLPSSFTVNDKKVVLSRKDDTTVDLTVNASKMDFPFSVLVTGDVCDAPLPHVISSLARYIKFYRYPKAIQCVLLKIFFDKVDCGEYYYHLDTYQTEGKLLSLDIPNDVYFIKPQMGARGLAIIEIDTSKITITEFFNHLHALHRKARLLTDNENRRKDENAVNVDYNVARDKYFYEMLEVTGLKFLRGIEHYENEAVEQFFSQELTIQRKCPYGNLIELRAIRSVTGKLLFVTRGDLDSSWVGTTTIVTDQNFDTIVGNVKLPTVTYLLDDIRKSLSHPDFPGMYGSIDIWINVESEVWGIFEFQPEYDGVNIPVEEHYRFMRDCVSEFIDIVK